MEELKYIIQLNLERLPINFQYVKFVDFEKEREKLEKFNKILLIKNSKFQVHVKKPGKHIIRIL